MCLYFTGSLKSNKKLVNDGKLTPRVSCGLHGLIVIRPSVFRIDTLTEYTLHHPVQAGSRVNLEIDTVARYVERMLQAGALPLPKKDNAP